MNKAFRLIGASGFAGFLGFALIAPALGSPAPPAHPAPPATQVTIGKLPPFCSASAQILSIGRSGEFAYASGRVSHFCETSVAQISIGAATVPVGAPTGIANSSPGSDFRYNDYIASAVSSGSVQSFSEVCFVTSGGGTNAGGVPSGNAASDGPQCT